MSAAARALGQAEEGVGAWLLELIKGNGSSPAQIIITGVLGVVPGVGQALDVRDLVLGVIEVSRDSGSVDKWTELLITLIGIVPVAGDALKVSFKLMRQGHSFGRVQEAAAGHLRGDIERYLRQIEWKQLQQSSQKLLEQTLQAFIQGLDSWAIKLLAGRQGVDTLIGQLKQLQSQSQAMLEQSLQQLQSLHRRMLGQELPANTAAIHPVKSGPPAALPSTAAPSMAAPNAAAPNAATLNTATPNTATPNTAASTKAANASSAQSGQINKSQGKTPKNSAQSNQTNASSRKQAQRQRNQSWKSGVPGEHLSDYRIRHKHRNFKKANNAGRLIEEWSLPRQGLDHLWSNPGAKHKPFVVGETKSSLFDAHTLMEALPADLRRKFEALRQSEREQPLRNGKPNVFDNQARDELANQRHRVSAGSEPAIRRGMNKPNPKTGLPTQMSHAWIQYVLPNEQLTPAGEKLKALIAEYEVAYALDKTTPAPYARWIFLVTGRQLSVHQKSKGQTHQVQHILNLPDNILDE